MGMYDEVAVPCPKCGEREFFQSKSGPCLLHTVDLKDCPEDILENVNRYAPYVCDRCWTEFSVDIDSRKSVFHNMVLNITPPTSQTETNTERESE